MVPRNVNLESYLCHQSSDGFSTPQLLMIEKKANDKSLYNTNKMFKKRKKKGKGINLVKDDFAPSFGVLISARIELFQNLLCFLNFFQNRCLRKTSRILTSVEPVVGEHTLPLCLAHRSPCGIWGGGFSSSSLFLPAPTPSSTS